MVDVIFSAGCNSNTPSYGPTKDYPVSDGHANMKLYASTKNGITYIVSVPNDGGNSVQTYFLTHLWGNAYEMVFAHGTLLQGEVTNFINSVWVYFEEQVESIIQIMPLWLQKLIADIGLDLALDLTYDATYSYTDPKIWQEMRGLADASGADYNTIVRVHMIAGLTQGKCSMIGSWGAALDPTSRTKLMQLRALDWNMDGPFRDHSSIVVYHPNDGDGVPFVNIAMSGFIGSLTGLSQNQLGISEIGVSYPDDSFGAESRIGKPFIFILREILQYDLTVDDATSRMANSRRTCDLILGVGDGKLGEFRGYSYSYQNLRVYNDKNLMPFNQTWHPRMSGLVYWGMDWVCPAYNLVLSQQLQKFYGKITPEVGIKYLTAVEQSGDNHLSYYDLTNLEFYVSFAAPHNVTGKVEAYARQFTKFDAKKLFNVTKPSI